MFDRIKDHYGRKDFWDRAIFFVAKDDSLNKVTYSVWSRKLLRLAKEAKQCKLENIQGAAAPTLSEAERALADSFLLDVLSIFPLLGLSVFERPLRPWVLVGNCFSLNQRGIRATGYEDPKGFVGPKAPKRFDRKPTPSISTFRFIDQT